MAEEARREADKKSDPHPDEQTILIPRPSMPTPAEKRRAQAEGESAYSAGIRRLAVMGIILIAMTAILGDVYLLSRLHDPPAGLIAIGAGGVGALATLLSVRSK